jgi:Calcineurin-like phosphoesterase
MPVRSFPTALLGVSCALLLAGFAPAGADPAARPRGAAPAAAPVAAAAAAPSAPALVSAGASTENASSYSLGSVALSAGHLYLAFITLSESGGAVDATPGVVGGSTTWTKVDQGEASFSNSGLTAYRFVPTQDHAGVALRTGTLSTVHEGVQFSVVDVAAGFDPGRPVAQYAAGSAGPSTGYTQTLPTAPQAGSLVVGAFAHGANEGSTPNPGWTEVPGSDLGHGSPARSAHVIYDDTDPGATAGSTWATSSTRRGIALEVPGTTAPPPPPPGQGVTVAAAGDICGNCADTANRVREIGPDAVVTLGDLAYPNGLLSEFLDKYGGGTDPQTRWGAPEIKDVTLPGYGNHDCFDVPRDTGSTKQGCDDAVTYFGPDSDFGADIAGTPGSYSTVVGDWLVVHLNSAGDVGSGRATSTEIAQQDAALQDVLATDTHACEVVAWHHPRYSSGEHGDAAFVDPWFETAHANGVDVVLGGHDHDYERFAPQDGNGNAVANGVRQFVVGTGGAALRPFETVQPNSVTRIVDKGVLRLQLRDDASYSWAFLDDVTGAVDDAGSGTCHP